MTPEERLERAGYRLSAPNVPVGNYVMTVRTGSLLFLSGHGAFDDGKPLHIGRLGDDLSTEDGRLAAETVMANFLATVRAELGSLSAIARAAAHCGDKASHDRRASSRSGAMSRCASRSRS